MKISKQEEYGLRILIRIAGIAADKGLSIPQLSELEGLSEPYVAKLTRAMRLRGLIQSTRGHKGGYILARSPEQITLSEIFLALGGAVSDEDNSICHHFESTSLCTSSVDCSIRSLWKLIQNSLDRILDKVTLADLSASARTNRRLFVDASMQVSK